MLLSAALRISLVDILRLAATDVDDALTEYKCGLEMLVSISTPRIISFNNLATVDEVTGW